MNFRASRGSIEPWIRIVRQVSSRGPDGNLFRERCFRAKGRITPNAKARDIGCEGIRHCKRQARADAERAQSPSLHSLTSSGHRLCPPCASTLPVRLNSPRPSRVAGRTHLLYLWRTLSRSRLTGDLQGRFVTLVLTLVRCSDRNAVSCHLARRTSVARCGRPCTAEWNGELPKLSAQLADVHRGLLCR
jgi:hypothetical protein